MLVEWGFMQVVNPPGKVVHLQKQFAYRFRDQLVPAVNVQDLISFTEKSLYFGKLNFIWCNNLIRQSMEQDGVDKQDVCDTMATLRNAMIQAEGGRLYGSDIFYVESCVYLMTLYDLVMSGHRVWQVYDCFYSTGDEDQKLFEYMISEGVRRNFEEFIETCWNIKKVNKSIDNRKK